jgi:Fe2+ transport system protein FeoA
MMMTSLLPVTLESAPLGSLLRIVNINDPETATLAVRLGIIAGETIELSARIPGGPVVFRHGGVELALGRNYCRHIDVEFSGS